MDYDRVPNISAYPPAPKADGIPGFSGGGAMPQTLSMGDDDDGRKKRKKLLYILIIVLFAISTAVSIGIYIYSNSEQAAASEEEELRQIGSLDDRLRPTESFDDLNFPDGVSPTRPKITEGITVAPSPTSSLPTVTPTPTTIIPTLRSSLPSPTRAVTAPPSVAASTRTTFWQINFSKSSYTKSELSGSAGYLTASGILKAPITDDTVVCLVGSDTFFTKKRDDSTVERLCDSVITPAPTSPICFKYNDNTGISISANIYGSNNCAASAGPDSGTYVMYSKVRYNCDASNGLLNVNINSCGATKDVFSDDFVLQ